MWQQRLPGFPAHGSGIGTGLIAGRILAESVGRHQDPGSTAALRHYEANYHRELGRVAAAYDVFRRFSQRLTGDDVAQLLAAGLISPRLSHAGLGQTMPVLGWKDLLQSALAARRAPKLALRLLPAVAGMQVASLMYGAYPRAGSKPEWLAAGSLAVWRYLAAQLFPEGGREMEGRQDQKTGEDDVKLAA